MFKTWICEKPIFERSIWNHWDSKESRTNNPCEGYHSRINRKITSPNASIYKLINLFKTEELLISNKIEKIKIININFE